MCVWHSYMGTPLYALDTAKIVELLYDARAGNLSSDGTSPLPPEDTTSVVDQLEIELFIRARGLR